MRKGGSIKKHTALYTDAIALYTNNLQLREALDAYLEMRSRAKMTLTERAVGMLLRRLDTVAGTDADKIAVVENATMGTWKSFYALSLARSQPAQPRREASYDIEELEDLLRRNIL